MLLLVMPAIAAEPPSVDVPVRTGADAPGDAAVVVGIEDYAFVPDVPYASRDADAFADALAYTRGVPEARIRRLRGANREEILRAVRAASAEVGDGGRLWIYFSGHGAAATDGSGRLLLGNDVTADPAVFSERAVRLAELTDAAGRVPTLLVLDTCYAGVGRSGAELLAGTRFAVPTWAEEPPPSRAEWSASSASELAAPLPAAGHGAFTYFVVGALRGWADGEGDGVRDGRVTLEEASRYVARELRAAGLDQQPVLRAADAGGTVLVEGDLERPPGLTGVTWTAPLVVPAPLTPIAPQGCLWPTVQSVSATMTEATVNGVTYDVSGKDDRVEFASHLQVCGFDEAAEAFRRWRAARRTVNSFAAYPPLLFVGYVPANAAANRRREFEASLLDEK